MVGELGTFGENIESLENTGVLTRCFESVGRIASELVPKSVPVIGLDESVVIFGFGSATVKSGDFLGFGAVGREGGMFA